MAGDLRRARASSRSAPRLPLRRALAGFSLVELLVALALALMTSGTLLSAGLVILRGMRTDEALSQVVDDATLALGTMRQQLAQAGFGLPRGMADGGLALRVIPPVLGCAAAGFADVEVGMLAAPACAPPVPDPQASDALAVAYEATTLPGPASNAVLASGLAAVPLDCLGNGIPPTVDTFGTYYLNDSRFYVADGNLVCHGPGAPGAATVAQNVERLQVRFGLSTEPPGSVHAGQVSYYGTAPPIGSPAWSRVVAVSLCVQVRSAAKVFDAGSAASLGRYVDCGNAARVSTDGYLRRTFATTVVLQGRLP